MTKPIDNIFAIKNEGGKNTDMENTTDSSPNNYIKEECIRIQILDVDIIYFTSFEDI